MTVSDPSDRDLEDLRAIISRWPSDLTTSSIEAPSNEQPRRSMRRRLGLVIAVSSLFPLSAISTFVGLQIALGGNGESIGRPTEVEIATQAPLLRDDRGVGVPPIVSESPSPSSDRVSRSTRLVAASQIPLSFPDTFATLEPDVTDVQEEVTSVTERRPLLPADPIAPVGTPPIQEPRPVDRGTAVPAAEPIEDEGPVMVEEIIEGEAPEQDSRSRAWVQLSAHRLSETAHRSVSELEDVHGAILRDRPLEVVRADYGRNGVHHYVRTPATTLDEASDLCARILRGGGDCFVGEGPIDEV